MKRVLVENPERIHPSELTGEEYVVYKTHRYNKPSAPLSVLTKIKGVWGFLNLRYPYNGRSFERETFWNSVADACKTREVYAFDTHEVMLKFINENMSQ